MKKIVLLLFTFLGICTLSAQNYLANSIDSFPKILHTILTDSLQKKELPSIKLFPNPVKNKLTVQVNAFDAGLVKVQIVNIIGQIERNDTRLLYSNKENMIIMFSLPAGVYFISLRQKNIYLKKKFIVQ